MCGAQRHGMAVRHRGDEERAQRFHLGSEGKGMAMRFHLGSEGKGGAQRLFSVFSWGFRV